MAFRIPVEVCDIPAITWYMEDRERLRKESVALKRTFERMRLLRLKDGRIMITGVVQRNPVYLTLSHFHPVEPPVIYVWATGNEKKNRAISEILNECIRENWETDTLASELLKLLLTNHKEHL